MASYQELLSQREKLDQQIESAKEAEFVRVVDEIRKKMLDYGITLADLGLHPKRSSKAARPRMRVEPKYCNPANPNEKWSGRGKEPKWIVGKNRAHFLIRK